MLGTRGFPNVQGGIEKHCENLYPLLAELGCEVTVLARSPYTRPSLHEYRGVRIVRIRALRQKYLEAFLHTFIGVFRAIRYKPDILHMHGIGPSFFIPLARLLRMKVVLTTHGPDYRHLKWKRPARMFLRLCELVGVLSANRIIGVSESICRDMEAAYGRRATYIPNGISKIDSSDEQGFIRSYGLEAGKYILSVGRLVRSKGFDDLMDAFLSIPESSIQGWKLVIAGGADHADEYSESLEKKACKDARIILTGALSGKPLGELYSHAGLFVLASRYEGLPIVLLEAMSFGLSCIASDIPGNKEVGLPEERYFNAGNTMALARAMLRYIGVSISEQEKTEQVALVRKKYDWQNIARRTLAVYEAALRH